MKNEKCTVYTPLFNLFFNFGETFYKRDEFKNISNWNDIFSNDWKNPYIKFKALSDSFFRNFKTLADIITERILGNRDNLGKDPKAFFKLEVDLITFFVFLKIQMDKIAELTCYFYDKKQITGKKRESFHKQKNWFLASNGKKLDPQYSDLLEEKTKWFDKLVGEMGFRDGIMHKNMNIYINTSNYEIKGAIIKKKKGHLSIGETEEVLKEISEFLKGFYNFCKSYERFFLEKTKDRYKFKEKQWGYDDKNIKRLLKITKNEGLLNPIDYRAV